MNSTRMTMDNARGFLKDILGYFAHKPPEETTQPASLRSQTLEAWVRTDAFLQHETNDLDGIDPDQLARTLTALENLVQYDHHPKQHIVSKFDFPMTDCSLSTLHAANTRLWERVYITRCRTQSFRPSIMPFSVRTKIHMAI